MTTGPFLPPNDESADLRQTLIAQIKQRGAQRISRGITTAAEGIAILSCALKPSFQDDEREKLIQLAIAALRESVDIYAAELNARMLLADIAHKESPHD